jgi:hypothetical protein
MNATFCGVRRCAQGLFAAIGSGKVAATMSQKSDKLKNRRDTFPSNTFIYVSVALVACVVVMALRLPDRWLTAVFCTTVPFLGTITYFRRNWASPRFWTLIAIAFLIHVPLIYFVFGILLRRQDDVGLLVCLPAVAVECSLLVWAVGVWAPIDAPAQR